MPAIGLPQFDLAQFAGRGHRHFIDNPASAAVLIRAGFLYTGVVEPLPCKARGEAVASRWMIWLA